MRMMQLIAFLALGLLAWLHPVAAQQVDPGDVPDDISMDFEMGSFAQNYAISGRINPFYLRGDFDGDGKPDYAVLIVARSSGAKGIGIWLSTTKMIYVLGAGKKFKLSAGSSADLDFIDEWQVYGKRPVEAGVEAGPPPALIGEAILAGKRESASGLIYWTGKQFSWYQQGD